MFYLWNNDHEFANSIIWHFYPYIVGNHIGHLGRRSGENLPSTQKFTEMPTCLPTMKRTRALPFGSRVNVECTTSFETTKSLAWPLRGLKSWNLSTLTGTLAICAKQSPLLRTSDLLQHPPCWHRSLKFTSTALNSCNFDYTHILISVYPYTHT